MTFKQIHTHAPFVAAVAVAALMVPSIAVALDMSVLSLREELLPQPIEEPRYAWQTQTQTAALAWGRSIEAPQVGSTTITRIYVEPGEVSVNAASLYIHYPTTTLAFHSVNNAFTDFSMSFVEYIDTDAGIIAMHYLQPYPGVSVTSVAADIYFVPLTTGTSTLTFLPETKALANDGRGTNVLDEAPELSLVVD